MKIQPGSLKCKALALAAAVAWSSVHNYAAESTNAPLSAAVTAAAPADAVAVPLVPRTNSAVIPRLNPGFNRRHESFVEIARQGDIDILFLGDSITDWWRLPGPQGGKAVFDEYFGDKKVANFGIAGDTTQGVLWRLQNGEGQGYKPRVVMLIIGTNNTGGSSGRGNTADEIAEGVKAVVAEIRKDFSSARILLLAIFPRGRPGDPVRAKISEINQRIARLNDLDHVFFLDIGDKFLDANGVFLPGVFRNDNLHPVAKGYEIWAEAVKAPIANLMATASSREAMPPATPAPVKP